MHAPSPHETVPPPALHQPLPVDDLSPQAPINAMPSETRPLLTSMVWEWDAAEKAAAATPLDTSGWALRGDHVDTIRHQMRSQLRESGARVIDLIKLFDVDAHGSHTQATPSRHTRPSFPTASGAPCTH
jgi:hypothetical protein